VAPDFYFCDRRPALTTSKEGDRKTHPHLSLKGEASWRLMWWISAGVLAILGYQIDFNDSCISHRFSSKDKALPPADRGNHFMNGGNHRFQPSQLPATVARL